MSAGPASADNIRDSQWALQNYHADTSVWPISQGAGVTVAVIDSGVSDKHQDLTGQVLPGADFSGEKTDGRVDTNGHGTGMAGLIAGHGHGADGADGVMGLAPKAKILPVRIAMTEDGDFGGGADTKFSEALTYAVDHGAKVVSMSIGGPGMGADSSAREAIGYAVAKDVVLVAATGNSGDHNRPVEYPAAFPGVVAVGAVERQGNLWAKSTWGPEITVVAPGQGNYSPGIKSTSDYGYASGTSDATAYVSAIAALVRSKYPNLSAGQVINRIIKSAFPPPDGSAVPNDHYGYGIASPSKALAVNPEVDNGAKDNPLLKRVESQGAPASPEPVPTGDGKDPGAAGATAGADRTDEDGVPVYVYVLAGVVGLLVVVGVVLLVVRGRRKGDGGPPPPPGGGTGGGLVPPPVPPQFGQPQPYGQPQSYGRQGQGQPGGYGQQPGGQAQQQPYGYPQAPAGPPSGPPAQPGGNPFR